MFLDVESGFISSNSTYELLADIPRVERTFDRSNVEFLGIELGTISLIVVSIN